MDEDKQFLSFSEMNRNFKANTPQNSDLEYKEDEGLLSNNEDTDEYYDDIQSFDGYEDYEEDFNDEDDEPKQSDSNAGCSNHINSNNSFSEVTKNFKKLPKKLLRTPKCAR